MPRVESIRKSNWKTRDKQINQNNGRARTNLFVRQKMRVLQTHTQRLSELKKGGTDSPLYFIQTHTTLWCRWVHPSPYSLEFNSIYLNAGYTCMCISLCCVRIYLTERIKNQPNRIEISGNDFVFWSRFNFPTWMCNERCFEFC